MGFLIHGIFNTWIFDFFTVFRQKWGPGPLGALQRAWAQKIARDIQIFSQNGQAMLVL